MEPQTAAERLVNRGQALARKGGRRPNEAIPFVKAGETQTARTKLAMRPRQPCLRKQPTVN